MTSKKQHTLLVAEFRFAIRSDIRYKTLLTVLFILGITFCSYSQSTLETEFEKKYQENIKKIRINDVYIPRDIHEAINELDKLSDEEGRSKLVQGDEKVVRDQLMIGLGRWMVVHWNFYEGSRLSHSLKELGISHPDDMAQFIIVSYYRHLKGEPLELEKRAKHYFEMRKSQQVKRDTTKIMVNH